MSHVSINRCIAGRNFLEFKTAAKAAKILKVSLDWLAYGDGPAPTADAGELAILDELDAAGMNYNKQQLDYIFQLVTRLEQESQEEFYELIIHSAKSTLRAIVNRKTKEYTVTEEPNTPDAGASS